MKIKSLLLGSAAALVAVTGARAADAVVIPEPEPVEYVRVCDMFGTGFYYIPGTETCFRIDGYVWYQIGFNNLTDSWNKNTRIRLNFDARSETEWGTLRGFIRIQADWNAQNQGLLAYDGGAFIPPGDISWVDARGDGLARIDQAIIELGGLRMGYTESAWAQSQNGGATNWGSYSWDGLAYGYQQRQLIAYTFSGGNGFIATLSLEDDGNDNYMPDVVAKVGLNQGWGSVWAKVAYDEDIVAVPTTLPLVSASNISGNDGWAASVGVQLNVPNMPGSGLRVIGFYSDNLNAYSVGGEWSVLASYRQQFTPTFAGIASVQYFNDINFGLAGDPDRWTGELAAVWVPITNFEVRAEYRYNTFSNIDEDTHQGFLRFTRFF